MSDLPPSRLPASITSRLRLPVVSAPMLRISGVDLVTACCNAGVIGSFPTVNARSTDQLRDWVNAIRAGLTPNAAPWAANLIMRNPRVQEDAAILTEAGVEIVITAVGSPVPVMPVLKQAGALVFADIASLHHARRAVEAGVDGLVLLSAGAGGQTGWANPFAFVRAVRRFYDGPVILSGGLTDGASIRAARVLGADLAYLGTRFIATDESLAEAGYKQMLADSSLDEVITTKTFTGLAANFLKPSILSTGLGLDDLDETMTPARASELYGAGGHERPKRWKNIWAAGHSVSGVGAPRPVAELVAEMAAEFDAA
ncbi:nitronate monooxygenase [Pseudooceanicola sp.]|uniref:NAD(P)H-dependent flavin oxidoreductase n=1 Tax=Pseudooceanicola sp. TaxID=1914328 RepID=UPI002639F452|nr:nitronate monooxygenase [Pseudooceanicola sp.]MDF1853978.1 nitronate monooxygenase [Pseudooceanicola sp.]